VVGRTPVGSREPVRELVVKVHELCNLACDHCYMYEAADQNWRDRPTTMSSATLIRLAERLAEHAVQHDLDQMRIVLHGGEPLLLGPAKLDLAIRIFQDTLAPRTSVSFALQTNGLLLTESFCRLFRERGVRVGVSIDGGRAANDRHRRYARGRSSYDATIRGISRLAAPENVRIYGGLLCTVDVLNDPIDTYESLLSHRPPRIDLLLPHGNWVYPPPGLQNRDRSGSDTATPYADWLIAIFDRWYGSPRRETGIRLFESLIALIVGGASDTEAVGLGIPASLVVETDGSVEGNDALKTTGPDGGQTGLTIFDRSFDEMLGHPLIAAARMGLEGLGPICRGCPVVDFCGGGLFAHRFSADHGFQSPSVYCADLYRLVAHIRNRVALDLAPRLALLRGRSNA
jgi:uncharacterized protein